ncbi:MAG: 7-cyano-7-deazaguanine synthase [Candidatus Sericytochromatia bacterium]|nr:MAG: 7-cyano-7-deazaguanine synthase [Candidatus Sericytochromatia bacterium]
MKKGIVLLSGGMDSSTCLAIAKQDCDEVACLHLNYGQRTEERELKSFNLICDYYKIEKKLIVDVSYLSQIGGSSLTDYNIDIENPNLKSKEIPNTYVPFRNANILAIATSWAEVINFNRIYIGAVEEDSAGYPDCTIEFYKAFEKAIDLGTKPNTKIEIITPLIELKKDNIVIKGLELKVPFELTWSCYQNNEKACGKCDSCFRRLRGFRLAGINDLIEYE